MPSFFQGHVASKAKFHITTGHDTVMGRLTFFGYYGNTAGAGPLESSTGALTLDTSTEIDLSREYLYQDELLSRKGKSSGVENETTDPFPNKQYALVQFERPVTCQNHALIIGSKLDTDIHANLCRIAFHGKLLLGFSDPKYLETDLPKLKVYKTKLKEGLVERVMDEYNVIGKNIFKKETNIATFAGLKVTLSTGEAGMIEGSFGQSGKIKIRIPGTLLFLLNFSYFLLFFVVI